MRVEILSQVKTELEKFKKDHRGEKPLYILVSPHEEKQLLDEVKKAGGYSENTLVTEYEGSKIIKHGALKKGDIHLSDELPETSS